MPFVKFSTTLRAQLAALRGAKLSVYVALALHLGEAQRINPSLETLAHETGYEERQIIRAISELEKLGLLTVERKHRHSSDYHVKGVAYGKSNDPQGLTDSHVSQEKVLTDISNGLGDSGVTQKGVLTDSHVTPRRESFKKNREEEESPPPSFSFWEILRDITGRDIPEGERREKALKAIQNLNPPFSEETAKAFKRWWWEESFFGKTKRSAPHPGQVAEFWQQCFCRSPVLGSVVKIHVTPEMLAAQAEANRPRTPEEIARIEAKFEAARAKFPRLRS